MMKIIICGDFYLDDNSSTIDVAKEIQNKVQNVDYNIVNLEAPVTSDSSLNQILKTGPHLKMKAQVVESLFEKLNINIVTLANNHILDYGEAGLHDTINFCNKNKIYYTGAGENLNDSQKPLRLTKDELTVSVINIAENEWASATSVSGGAHPLDIIENSKIIKSEKALGYKVIVIFHGGNEYYQYPNPKLKKILRFYVESGADVIVCHHSHCISGFEEYNKVPIFYSLGNFIFTQDNKSNSWYTGLMVQLSIDSFGINYEVNPVFYDHINQKLDYTSKKYSNLIQNELTKISNTIKNDTELEEKWQDFIEKEKSKYLKVFSSTGFLKNRYVREILYRSGLSKFTTSKKQVALCLNMIRCESHFELTKDILESYLNE